MKALLLQGPGDLVITDVPAPERIGARDLLIRIRACAICGSDVHGYDGSTGRRIPPLIMGHEASGEVVRVGEDVAAFAPGDRVTFDSTLSCGECPSCREGAVNLCENRRVLGVSCDEYRQDGAFAEFLVVPARIVYRVPDSLSFAEAAITEPFAVAAHAMSLTPLSLNDRVAVVGAGLIGLCLIQLLKASGAGEVVALDPDEQRRHTALALGADHLLDPGDPEAGDGPRADRAFEVVGTSAALASAVASVRSGGSVTLIGNISPRVDLPLQQVVTRQISLLGSCAIAGEYPLVLDMLARGKIEAKPIISAIAPLEDGPSWFDRLYSREPGLLKVVLEP